MFLATIRVRAVGAPLYIGYTSKEFEFYLSDSESKLLLHTDGHAAAQTAASKLNIPCATVKLTSVDSDITFTLTHPESGSNSNNSLASIINDPFDVALLLHTSGTTSLPTGVPLSQFNLAYSVTNIKSVYKLTESDSTVIVLPLFRIHGLIAVLLSSLGAGASVTLPSAGRSSVSTFWADMKRSNATWYSAVPTIHRIILNRHFSKPEPEYPCLRFIQSCSNVSLAPGVLRCLKEEFKAPVLEAYAMTEATHLICTNPLPEDGPHKPGSVGQPVGQELAILDANGVVQEPKCKGEVCIRGPNVTKGYMNNLEANQLAFQCNWFHTGDVGFLDKDGYLTLLGRIKDPINHEGIFLFVLIKIQ